MCVCSTTLKTLTVFAHTCSLTHTLSHTHTHTLLFTAVSQDVCVTLIHEQLVMTRHQEKQ